MAVANRVASAATPFARSTRAKPVIVTTGSGNAGASATEQAREFALYSDEVLAVLQRGAERGFGSFRIEPAHAEDMQRLRPVDRLGNARGLDEVRVAQSGNCGCDVVDKLCRRVRDASADDRDFPREVGVRHPVIQAAALERVVYFAS